MIQASDGNVYGTTGSGIGSIGTIFKMTPGGVLTTLVNFDGTNGAAPRDGLVQASDGNFYGSTPGGGSGGNGTLFKVSQNGVFSTLVNLTNGRVDRLFAGLVPGSDGNFYGSTADGGSGGGFGALFKMTTSGALTTLVNVFDPTHVRRVTLVEVELQIAEQHDLAWAVGGEHAVEEFKGVQRVLAASVCSLAVPDAQPRRTLILLSVVKSRH